MTPQYTRKLQSALIAIGKEAEKTATPSPDDLYRQFEQLMTAIDKQDMKAMKAASTELAGSVVKFMVEKL
jgi:hypothetical protein